MADFRHLKKRHQGWYFRTRVPADLRARVGKDEIVETLGTQDLKLAQALRWERLAKWNRQFAVWRGDKEAAETLAREAYQEDLRLYQEWLRDNPDEDPQNWITETIEQLVNQAEREAGRPLDGPQDLPPVVRARFDALTDLQDLALGRKAKASDRYREPLSETAERYLAAKGDRLTNQTKAQHGAVYRLLADFVGNKPLSRVTRKDAVAFIDEVATLHPSWGRSPATKDRSFSELKAMYGGGAEGLSDRTINRYLSALISLWKWAKARDEVEGDCPFEGLNRRIGRKNSSPYVPLELDDLKRLFAAPQPNNRMLWEIPLVGLYSGMRLNEICSLGWENVRQEDGIWYFDIVAAKSEAGVRVVPIHSKLSWLVERRPKGGTGQIWPDLKPGGPDLKYSWYFSKAFTSFRRDRKVGDDGERKTFHSLRKNAVRCLERARVPQTEAAEIVGHEKAGITYRVYNPDGMTMAQRREIVELFQYPGLAVPILGKR